MLFLFSDVTEFDAPTKILKGLHINIAQLLKSEGDAELTFRELAMKLPKLLKKVFVIHSLLTALSSIMVRNLSLWHNRHCCSGTILILRAQDSFVQLRKLSEQHEVSL